MRRVLDRFAHRIRSLVRGAAVDRELERELRFHLESQVEENLDAGMTPEQARASATRLFGPRTRIEEECRDARGVAWLASVAQDLRYARRSLARQPLLVVAAVLSIAVGFAANTIVFGVGTELLFTRPSAREPEQLVSMRLSIGSHVSHPHWRVLQESGALEQVAGYQIERDVTIRLGSTSTTMLPLIVTANFFDMLDVPFALGRGFSANEAAAERDPRVVVVSHGFWSRRLGEAGDVLSRVVLVNGNPYAIIGVLPADFRSLPGFGVVPELYLPLSKSLMPDIDEPYAGAVQLVGRLRAGQRLEEGRTAVATVVTRLPPRPGEQPADLGRFASLEGASEEFDGTTTFFAVLLVVTGLVLAIACANVAGLLVARGAVRRREIAVRAALGASRRRLVQQLLADGFWLAVGGTAVGLAITAVVLRLVSRIELPLPVPVVLNPQVGGGLLWYALGLLMVTTVVSALVPAVTVSRQSVTSALRTDEPQYGHRRLTLRNLLVVVQVAVALLLLTTAGLFVRNLALTHTLDPGFDVAPLLVAQVTFPPGRHSTQARLTTLDAGLARLQALPGVQQAAFARGVPLTLRSGSTTGADLRIESDGSTVPARYEGNWVSAGYFATMGMRLLAGRDVAPADTAGTPAVALVSQTFAQRYLPGRDPVGVRLVLPGPPNTAGFPTLVVGVVSDGKHRSIGETQKAALYLPYAQNMGRSGGMTQFLVRTSTDPAAALRPIRDALAALDPSLAVEVQTMQAALAFAFLPSRVGAILLGASGALGLLLALVGLYAAVAFAVSRRTAEIGIRRALGASGASVIRLVLGDWAWLVLTGIAAGLVGAWFITRPLAQFLVDGLSATDPMSFVVTPVLLAALSAVATVVPAMAALRVDPARVLRNE